MNSSQLLRLCIIATSLVLLSSCGDSEGGTVIEEKIPVEGMRVSLGTVRQSLDYDGDVNAETEVQVFSKIPDRIEKYEVEVGDSVRTGDPIARIRAVSIEQGLRQAQAALVAARAQESNVNLELERAKRLLRENAMSQQQFDAVKTQSEAFKAQREQAEAMVTTAKEQVSDAVVRSPIDGVISRRGFEAGDMASPVQPLASVVKTDRVHVEFDVSENDLGKIRIGQEAEVHVRSYPDRAFPGVVARISPVLDPIHRMAAIEVFVDNKLRMLKPGMFARIEVIVGELKDVIILPRHAVIESTTLVGGERSDGHQRRMHAFVVVDGKAQQKNLDVLYSDHGIVAVRTGIAEGDTLITVGQHALRDGSSVVVVRQEGTTP